MKAWDCVSLDAVAGNDQTGKRYWQRIEDMFHRLMPVASARSLRSLQARFEIIKSCCSRWSGCLNQVRNAPPSGCTTDEYDHIAMERYKQMSASKSKPFVFQHCWKLLEHSEKWRLRDQETPPKKGAFVELDYNDDRDALKGEINQGKPDGREKEKAKKQAEATSLREKIGGKSIISEAASLREKETICAPTFLDLVKSKETLVAKLLETEMAMAEKKHQDEMARWQELREVEERKVAIDERRVLLEENKVMAEILAEENKVMMMDPRTMDPMSREWWDIRRGEILQRRRQASGGATSAGGGGGASAGGGDGAGKLGDDGV